MHRRMTILAILYGCPDDAIQRVVDRAMSRNNITLATAGDYIAQAMYELKIRDVHLTKHRSRKRGQKRETNSYE